MSERSVSEWEPRADYADNDLSWAQRDHKLCIFTYADNDLHAVSMVINAKVK